MRDLESKKVIYVGVPQKQHATARWTDSKQHISLAPAKKMLLCMLASIQDQEYINEACVISNTQSLQ